MTIASTTPSAIAPLLADCGELRRYGFGKELVPAGELPAGVWLIEKGSVRSLVALPPKGEWRTVERYEAGCLVGWLGVLQERPIEHLRTADLTEARFISAEQFLDLYAKHSKLRVWCASQRPAAEVVDLLLRLSHANPARANQLKEWLN